MMAEGKTQKRCQEPFLGWVFSEKGPGTFSAADYRLNKTADPRLSMLRRFAKAMNIPLADLIDEKKSRAK